MSVLILYWLIDWQMKGMNCVTTQLVDSDTPAFVNEQFINQMRTANYVEHYTGSHLSNDTSGILDQSSVDIVPVFLNRYLQPWQVSWLQAKLYRSSQRINRRLHLTSQINSRFSVVFAWSADTVIKYSHCGKFQTIVYDASFFKGLLVPIPIHSQIPVH